MISVCGLVDEGVQETHHFCVISHFAAPVLIFIMFGKFLKDLYLVKCSLHIVRSTFLYFNCNIGSELKVSTKPNSRKMSPSKFLDNHITIDKDFSNMNGMIPAELIILDPFIL